MMSLEEFKGQYGLHEPVQFDAAIHRYGEKKAGWYIGFDETDGNNDPTQILIIGDWSQGDDKHIWCSNGKADAFDPTLLEKIKQAKLRAKKEKESSQAKAAKTAKYLLTNKIKVCSYIDVPYLVKKQLSQFYGARYIETDNYKCLAIPLVDIDGNLHCIQKIMADGSKMFIKGGRVEECFHQIGEVKDTIYITEGFATGASIHEATKEAVFCCMSLNNIEKVYFKVRERYPKIKIILCPDNDQFKKQNAGFIKAQHLKQAYGLEYKLPVFKDVTNKPTDFNDLYILEGIDQVKKQIQPKAAEILDTDLQLNKSGQAINNLSNITKVFTMDNYLKDLVWYDNFHYKYIGRKPNGKTAEWTDEDDLCLTVYMQDKLKMANVKDDMVRKSRILHCMSNIKNEPKDWLETLQWDGTMRVYSFFNKYMGCNDSEYTSAVSKNFWVSMIARVMIPGSKVDNMVILEGKQGCGKSTALSIIGGKWYVESNETMGSKDFYQIMHGNLVVEIGELDSFNKSEVTTIKKVISTTTDRYRPPYGREPRDFPRQCIFSGSTNEKDYLKDSTGGRRFWPIDCPEIDLEMIKDDRDQLFAEALKLFNDKIDWHTVPEMAQKIQESRLEQDPWTDTIAEYLQDQRALNCEYVTVSNVLTDGLGMSADKFSKIHSNRIGKILRVLKWSKIKIIKRNELTIRGFFPDN